MEEEKATFDKCYFRAQSLSRVIIGADCLPVACSSNVFDNYTLGHIYIHRKQCLACDG